MLRIGQRWQPDPLLRRSARAPVHTLAVQSRAIASLRILDETSAPLYLWRAPHGHAYMPDAADPNRLPAPPPDASSTRPNPPATSRFLTAGPDVNGATSASPSRDPHATVVDHRTRLPACFAYQRPCGGRMGPAPAQSPSRSTQTTSPSAYPPWCRTPRAASAPPFSN